MKKESNKTYGFYDDCIAQQENEDVYKMIDYHDGRIYECKYSYFQHVPVNKVSWNKSKYMYIYTIK